jgi:hypothetical protein
VRKISSVRIGREDFCWRNVSDGGLEARIAWCLRSPKSDNRASLAVARSGALSRLSWMRGCQRADHGAGWRRSGVPFGPSRRTKSTLNRRSMSFVSKRRPRTGDLLHLGICYKRYRGSKAGTLTTSPRYRLKIWRLTWVSVEMEISTLFWHHLLRSNSRRPNDFQFSALSK